jgi:signal transduction histidine kinase
LDADPTRLTQVFTNLLNNAAKYSERGGHIRLNVERLGREAAVRVSDDGIGIRPGDLPRIFDMFVQVERSSERSGGGLGIGLSLVQRLVEIHGGSVEVHSDGPGQGSEFVVHLPVLADLSAHDADQTTSPVSRAANRAPASQTVGMLVPECTAAPPCST